jgi:hypothetical protein
MLALVHLCDAAAVKRFFDKQVALETGQAAEQDKQDVAGGF